MDNFARLLKSYAYNIKYPYGLDLTKQPNNEVWYVSDKKEDGDWVGDWGKQDGLTVLSHEFNEGIGIVRYSDNLVKMGEMFIRDAGSRSFRLLSFPKTFKAFNAFCLDGYAYHQFMVALPNQFSYNKMLGLNKSLFSRVYCSPESKDWMKNTYFKGIDINIVDIL